MKNLKLAAIAGGLLLITGIYPSSRAQEAPAESPTKQIMREKLALSQQILEGLALENFDNLVARSARLTLISQAAAWPAVNNPDYTRFNLEFRRRVAELNTAAQGKNIDGVAFAYVKVTMSCVECHKFVRGVRGG